MIKNKLHNFFNLRKKKYKAPSKFVFVVGSGRCGTLQFSTLFKNNQKIASYHERNALLTSFYQYAKFNKLNIDYGIFFDSFTKFLIEKKIYMEASPYLCMNAIELYKKLNAKIIILFRDPLKTCESLMRKGWYKDIKYLENNKILGCQDNNANTFHHNFDRLIPHGSDFQKWKKLPRICKIKWFWNFIYTDLLKQIKFIKKINVKLINIEKLDYETYKDTCRWLGCKPNLSQKKFFNIKNERKNKINRKKIKISKKDLEYFKKCFNKTEKLLFKNNE